MIFRLSQCCKISISRLVVLNKIPSTSIENLTFIKDKDNVALPHLNINKNLSLTDPEQWDQKKINGAAGGIYSNVNDIDVTFWGRKVRVVKNASGIVANHTQPEILHSNVVDSSNKEESVNKPEEDSLNGEKVLSPMPGVFYSSQSPDKPPFVNEGDLSLIHISEPTRPY